MRRSVPHPQISFQRILLSGKDPPCGSERNLSRAQPIDPSDLVEKELRDLLHPISNFQTTLSFRSDQRARRGHTLPGSMELYPCVHKSFAVNVGLPFLRPFDSKHSDDYSGIPVHLDSALLRDGLRRLVVRRFDTRQKFAPGGNASVDVDGYKRIFASSMSSALVSFASRARFHAFSSAITRPPSLLMLCCCAAVKPARNSNIAIDRKLFLTFFLRTASRNSQSYPC